MSDSTKPVSTTNIEVEVEVLSMKKNASRKTKIKKIYDTTLETIKEKVSAITIRPSTLHLIIKYVMESIEETPIKGAEQKEMALKLIRALVVDFTDGEDEKVLVQLLDDGTISNMIDLIVDATRGKLNINTIATVGSGCFNSCLPYLFSTKKTKKLKN